MQDGPKAVWSIPYVSLASFFPSLKQNFIAYRSSKVSWRLDCIFEIHQLWQSGFSRVYSNCCCSCSFEPEIIKIDQLSHNMYTNNIVNFQDSTTILNARTKKSGNLLNAPCMCIRLLQHNLLFMCVSFFCISVCVCVCVCVRERVLGWIGVWMRVYMCMQDYKPSVIIVGQIGFEFKPAELRLKIDLVSYPARAEWLVNMAILSMWVCEYVRVSMHI